MRRNIGTGLLDCLQYYGIPHLVDKATKNRIRKLIVEDPDYPTREAKELEWYSRSDGTALKALSEKLLPKTEEEWAHALQYGEYCKALAALIGYPIDIPLLDRIKANIGAMAWVLKQEVNAIARIYDSRGVLKKEWLREEAKKLGLEWTWFTEISKEIATDKKTLQEAVYACPAFREIAELLLEVGNLKDFTVDESPGGFHTPKVVPLQSATLRTQSSGLMFLVKWFRGLIVAPPGFVLIHADYKAQEMRIAAALSGDEAMLEAVAGDPHLKLAIESELIPPDGNAETHHAEREKAKVCNFRILYGSGGEGLAKFLGLPIEQGFAVLDTHRRIYPRYWEWSNEYTREACARGYYETKDGFRVKVPPWPLSRPNIRRMRNAPIQSMGAVIHRKSGILLHQRGQGVFEMCGSQHDSWDIFAPEEHAEEAKKILVECMREASAWALDGYEIPVDTRIYRPGERFIGNDDVQAAFDKTMALLERVEKNPPADMPVKKVPVPREYKPDWKQAEKFLKFLFPEPGARFTLKVIDNSPAKTGARQGARTLETAKEWLSDNTRQPWGAYVSPHATDGKGAKAGNVTGARCLMADLDGSPLSVLERFPLPPSVILESSPGHFHIIWLCDDLEREMVKPANVKIAELLGSDPQCIDLARCVRLPGCFNFKRAKPFRVRVKKMPRRKTYAFAEIAAALGGVEAPEPKQHSAPAEELSSEEREKVQDALDLIPADDRATWLKVGMALHSVDERALWDDWSAKSEKYDEAVQDKTWNSFSEREDGVTIASIFHLAKEYEQEEQEQPANVPHGNNAKREKPQKSRGNGQEQQAVVDLGEWDAGDDPGQITPREWLLGNQFCRTFVSSLFAAGGTGKTSVRLLQLISMALGRSLCGQHVFQRCVVLLVTLEDNDMELQRRIQAALKHYKIDRAELKGWLFCKAVRRQKLAVLEGKERQAGPLEKTLRAAIERRKPDIICLDPFVKTHNLIESSNEDMNFVADLMVTLAIEYNIAVDSPHHVHKGTISPGDADSGRGASGIRDAARLAYTLCVMSEKEADDFSIKPEDRFSYVRIDSAKVNIAANKQAEWFHLTGVRLGNVTPVYPHGDTVQVAEPWYPPEVFVGLSIKTLDEILDDIEVGPCDENGVPSGERYSNAPAAHDRAGWQAVQRHAPDKTDKQCRDIIRSWLKSGLLYSEKYQSSRRRTSVSGLFVDNSKRPGAEG
jgi:hypothetical protein